MKEIPNWVFEDRLLSLLPVFGLPSVWRKVPLVVVDGGGDHLGLVDALGPFVRLGVRLDAPAAGAGAFCPLWCKYC